MITETELSEAFTENLEFFICLSMKVVRRREVAEEVVQKSFLNVWKHRDQFDGRSQLKTYLGAVVHRESIAVVRTCAFRRELTVPEGIRDVTDSASWIDFQDLKGIDPRPNPFELAATKEHRYQAAILINGVRSRVIRGVLVRMLADEDEENTSTNRVRRRRALEIIRTRARKSQLLAA